MGYSACMKLAQQQAGNALSWAAGVTLGLLLGVGLLIATPRLMTPKSDSDTAKGAAPLVNTEQQEPTLPEGSTATKAEANAPAEGDAGAEASAADGKTLYVSNCAGCHGPEAKGGMGPALAAVKDWSPDEFKTALRDGKTPTRTLGAMMPKFADAQLNDEQINAIGNYIKTLN